MLNSPLGDPALLVEILWERRALLFDLGELASFRPAKLLKISHAFISHTHIDHFIGFDVLLRLMLNREKELAIFGPPGFLENVRGKLAGYTWNLTAEYPFAVRAREVHPGRIYSRLFRCQDRFRDGEEREEPFEGILVNETQLTVKAVHLDHLIPSLAFALEERFHINVHRDALADLGLKVGPWLKELKEAIWRGEKEDYRLRVPAAGEESGRAEEWTLQRLKEAVTVSPGQKIAYVADCRFSPENIGRILDLVRGADLFFCEAAFLDEDRERAQDRAHLTARQAGELARRAGVKNLEVFHFSPKYEGEEEKLIREAQEEFRKNQKE